MVVLPFNKSSFEGSFEEGLSSMNEGDGMSFIVDAEKLFNYFFKMQLPIFLKKGDVVKMDVKLNRILNQKEYEAQLKEYKQMVQDRDIEEQRRLKVFLDTTVVSYSAIDQGMYVLPIMQGTGSFPKKGDILKINYTGSFLNGKVFESTYERGQPLEYICGEQGQVIKGLEIAINFMNEGAKTKFIIPSHLAFGEEGSSTGIVPPYSTVIYEIELLNLTSKNN
jgi:FKBP-type peptidyl-prolyl cis-trans isomerase